MSKFDDYIIEHQNRCREEEIEEVIKASKLPETKICDLKEDDKIYMGRKVLTFSHRKAHNAFYKTSKGDEVRLGKGNEVVRHEGGYKLKYR
jgi:hypothetical protein